MFDALARIRMRPRLPTPALLLLAAAAMTGCKADYTAPETAGSTSRTECPAGQHLANGACVANATE